MDYPTISGILYIFGFRDVKRHETCRYGEHSSRVIATKDGLEYHKLYPSRLGLIDITPESELTRSFEATVTFSCDKTVALSEPCFHSLHTTVRRTVGLKTAKLLDNWLHGIAVEDFEHDHA